MSDNALLRINLENGKYTVVQEADGALWLRAPSNT